MEGKYEPSEKIRQRGSTMAVDLVTIEVVDALAQASIDSILLKGPAIASWLYDPGEVRAYSDTDLLVAPDNVEAAESVLEGLGFRLPDIYDEDDRPSPEHAWLRDRDRVRVDLHWNLVGIEADKERAWRGLSSQTSEIEVRGRRTRVLGEPARALHVALHAAQHGSELGKAIEDLERATVRLAPDVWERAYGLAVELDGVESFALGLRLDEKGSEIARVLGLPDQASLAAQLRAEAAPPSAVAMEWFMSQKGWRAKARLVIHNVFPSRAFMREWSPLAAKSWWGMLLAYVYRPIYLGIQAVSGLKALAGRKSRR